MRHRHLGGQRRVVGDEQAVDLDAAAAAQLVHQGQHRRCHRLPGHAALALEPSRAQSDLRRLAMVEDRERIARDLHDQVIQRLFATGLALEGSLRMAPPEGAIIIKGVEP